MASTHSTPDQDAISVGQNITRTFGTTVTNETWKMAHGVALPLDEVEELAETEEDVQIVDPETGRSHSFSGIQVIIMTAIDGKRSPEEVADFVSELLEVEIPVEDIRSLAHILYRLGLLKGFAPTSFGARLTQLASENGDEPAVIVYSRDCDVETLSWNELEARSNQLANYFLEREIGAGSTIVVAVPNGSLHFIASFAGWKVGAMVLPLRASLPNRELTELIALVENPVVVGAPQGQFDTVIDEQILEQVSQYSTAPPPDVTANPGHAIASGGSTGRPKIVVDPTPWARVPEDSEQADGLGFASRQIQLLTGPLYHTTPFSTGYGGLFEAHTLVVMEKFDASTAVDLIEKHKIAYLAVAPTVMQRIARLDKIEQRDLSSLKAVFHTGAPCPPWAKRAWIDLIGAECVFEAYGSTEALGTTTIRGDEWLERPGSVGKPVTGCEFAILDAELKRVPANEVGEIFSRWPDGRETFSYVGANAPKNTEEGFVSVGDLGWFDDDGYLFIADRRTDLIITGGANVYPAEVEAAISEHPGVFDVAVIGLPDEDWGKRVHAIVVRSADSTLAKEALNAHCRSRIATYKCPKTFEFVDSLPRNDAGKIRRRALVDERLGE